MAARSAVRHAPFFQRLHTVAIRPEVCFLKGRDLCNAGCGLFSFG